jgi:hypothetical protein
MSRKIAIPGAGCSGEKIAFDWWTGDNRDGNWSFVSESESKTGQKGDVYFVMS